jgi:hypothetical protein
MKLTTEKLRQIIKEELMEMVNDNRKLPKQFSTVMMEANKLYDELKANMPPPIGRLSRELDGIEIMDLVYQKDKKDEIVEKLFRAMQRYQQGEAIFQEAEKMVLDLKKESDQYHRKARELFHSDERETNPMWRVTFDGFSQKGRDLADMIDKIEMLSTRRRGVKYHLDKYYNEVMEMEDMYRSLYLDMD